jgi:MFS transporter, DHA3 family, macrolide efflux protein
MMETVRALRTFLIVWMGQIVSTVGSSLTGFVLGVWVYQQTGSATQFALIALCATLPAIVLGPIAGALVDRHDRRTVMILADLGAALSTVALALLYSADALQVWHIWAATGFTAICGAFQGPAYGASLSMLVPPEHRARANGLMQTGQALAIIAPVVAAGLVASIGVGGVIVIDLATFAFAVTTLLVVRIPRPEVSAAGRAAKGTLRREATYGWEYLRARPGLFWLTVLFAFFNFVISISAVLVQPLILSFSSVVSLGWLMMAGGSGMLAGSLVMGAWGGPKRRINGVLGFVILGGVAMFMHGLAPSPWLIAVGAPAFLFTIPFVGGSFMAILQGRVPPDVQGRVFAMVRMLGSFATPLAYVLAGPLADRVFEPAMAPGGALSGVLGPFIGVGDGRGIAVMFMLSGLVLAASAGAAWGNRAIRSVEHPDALDAPPEPQAAPAPAPAAASVDGAMAAVTGD